MVGSVGDPATGHRHSRLTSDGWSPAAGSRMLLNVSLRLAAAWIVLTVLVLLGGRELVRVALPFLEVAVNVMQGDFSGKLALVQEKGQWVIQMLPLTVRPIPMTDQVELRGFLSLQQYVTHVDHTLVPVVLLLSGVLAWPIVHWREFGTRVLLAVPVLLLVLVLCAPVLLIGQVQMTLIKLALRAGAAFHEPWAVTLMIFMESGGRWLLPITAAVACIAGARSIFTAAPEQPAVSTPAPRREPAGPPVFPPVPRA
jgi:hypothetical protein